MIPITSIIPANDPNGNNNWYRNNTGMTFTVVSESDINKIYYRWDHNTDWKEFVTNDQSNETLSVTAQGGELSATLDYLPVVPFSLQLYSNTTLLTQNLDYILDVTTGTIDFITSIVSGKVIKGHYNYYSSFNDELQNALGGETFFDLSKTHIREKEFTITINDQPLQSNNYTLNASTGVVTFTSALQPNDNVKVTYNYIYLNNSTSVTNEVVINSATGGETSFELTKVPVFDSSEKIYINKNSISRNTDYTINYTNGLVTLLFELSKDDIVTADYYCLVSNEVVISSATSGQKNGLLKNNPVVDDTYQVYLNSNYLHHLSEYSVVSDTSVITLSSEAFPNGLTASDKVEAFYHYSITSEVTLPSATGGEQYVQLFSIPIQGTVRIKLNGKVLTESNEAYNHLTPGFPNYQTGDYMVNYNDNSPPTNPLGKIALKVALNSGDQILSDYYATLPNYESVVYSALGEEQILTLDHPNVVSDTLQLKYTHSANTRFLNSLPDYTLSTTGELVLRDALALGDEVTATYAYAVPTENVLTASGGEYQLALAHSVITTLTLYKNSNPLTSNVDYVLNAIDGTITLTLPLINSDHVTATYSYSTSRKNEFVVGRSKTNYQPIVKDKNFVITKNSVDLVYDSDYIIDLNTGIVDFILPITTSDVLKIDYKYGQSLNSIETFSSGNMFTLTHGSIYSQTITQNPGGILLVEYADYTLNHDTGVLHLTTTLTTGLSITVDYNYNSPLIIPTQGIHPIEFYSIDVDNNKELTKTFEFKLDSFSPTTLADIPLVITNPVSVNFFGSDLVSGVERTYYTLDGTDPTTSSPSGTSVTLNVNNVVTLKYFSIDYSGNSETINSTVIRAEVDSTLPEVYIQESFPINGNNGYYRTSPTITLESTKKLDLDKIYYKLVAADHPTTALYTSPANTYPIDLSANLYIVLSIDGSDSVQIDLRGIDPANTTITEIINNINSTTRIVYTVLDENSTTNATFVLKTLHPNIKSVHKIRNTTTGENYIYISNTTTTITFTGVNPPSQSDIMSVDYEYATPDIAYETDADGNTGTGCITLKSPTADTGKATSEIKFLVPASSPATDLVFGLDDTIEHSFVETLIFHQYTGGFTIPNDGQWVLTAYSLDLQSRKSVENQKEYQLDGTQPITSIDIIGGTLGNNNYYTGNPTIRFHSNDTLSGIDKILYKWNSTSAPFYEYNDTRPIDSSTTIPGQGTHTLYYYSNDRAGNQEGLKNHDFKLDTVTPITTNNSANLNTSLNINSLKIGKTGDNPLLPLTVLTIVTYTSPLRKIMTFTGGSNPMGPFDLRNFTLGDIRDLINSNSGVGYSAAIETDYISLSEAEKQPANMLFDVDVVITSILTKIYSSIGIKLFASDVTSGIFSTFYGITNDGSMPIHYTTPGLYTVTNETVMVRPSSTWGFHTTALGGETQAKLSNQPIVDLILKKNNVMISSSAYSLEKETGKITLNSALITGDILTANYIGGTLIVIDEEAIYKLRYYSVDNAGNQEIIKPVTPAQIQITRNLPTITFTPSTIPSPSDWYTTATNITITALAAGGATIVSVFFRWDTDDFTLLSGITPIPNDGEHTLESYAIDSNNRVSKIKSEIFKKDVVAPATVDNSIKSINQIIYFNGSETAHGGETDAYLNNPYIMSGTLQLFKDTVLMLPAEYSIDLITGHIIFALPLILGNRITAIYNYTITSNTDTNIILTVSDNIPGSGVYRIYYEIGTAPISPNPLTSPFLIPTITPPYTATIHLTTSGSWVVSYRSEDVAGNLEGSKYTQIIRVDKSSPVTQLITSINDPDGLNDFYVSPINISFNIDANPSGLKATYYRINSSSYQLYTGISFPLADGISNIEFYSIDLAGNVETVKSRTIKKDTVPPVTSDTVPTIFVSNSTITLSVDDQVSGRYKTYYQILYYAPPNNPINQKDITGETFILSVPTTTIWLANKFVFDETVYVNGSPTTNYTINDYGQVIFNTPVIGTIAVDYSYSLDLNNKQEGVTFKVTAENNYIIKYFSVDNAGNYETVKTASNILKMDLTPPDVTNILPTDLIINDTTQEISFRVVDQGLNPSGIDPFSIRLFVDGIEYSLLKNKQYFILEAVGLYADDLLDMISVDIPKSNPEVLIFSAPGGETSFYTTHIPVAYNTQRLYKNNTLLIPDLDYVFNNIYGNVELLSPLVVEDNLKIAYRYLTLFHTIYDVTIAGTTSYNESFPAGNTQYTLSHLPIASNSYSVFIGTVDQNNLKIEGVDYTLSSGVITFPSSTIDAVNVIYKQISGALRDIIPNFDVVNSIVIDPSDTSGNIKPPIIFDFSGIDIEPPYVSELNPLPNVKDVSINTNIMFKILDNQSGVNIESIKVTVNGNEYKIITNSAVRIQYIGPAASANLTIANDYFITRINGLSDISFSFYDANFDTLQKIVDYINGFSTYVAEILDNRFSLESSQTLLQIQNIDITAPLDLASRPLTNLNFVYSAIADGYLITVTPISIFDNQQVVSVIIEGQDKNNNVMTPVKYNFTTQIGAFLSVQDRLIINSSAQTILNRILTSLASTYNISTPATEFYHYEKMFALELARYNQLLARGFGEYIFDSVENKFLYQNFGRQMNFYPSGDYSLDTYRNFLQAINNGYLRGTLKTSIQEAIGLFTDGNVYINERFQHSSDLADQFIFDVLVEISSTSKVKSLIELLNRDLYNIIRELKPAHTFFLLGFLFSENIGSSSGCIYIPLYDIHGNPIIDNLGNPVYEIDDSAFKIFKNGTKLKEIRDFTIDVFTSKITLTIALSPGDQVTADYKERHIIAFENISGNVSDTVLHTSHDHIVPLSYIIKRNGRKIIEGTDYRIDLTPSSLNVGTITLFKALETNDTITISYDWYVQILNETAVGSAVGGEYILYLDFAPIVGMRFLAGQKVSDFSMCDRVIMTIEQGRPLIDFKLNGKAKWFETNDPLSLLNDESPHDVAKLVDTHWITDDALETISLVVHVSEAFSSIQESLTIKIKYPRQDEIFSGIIEQLYTMVAFDGTEDFTEVIEGDLGQQFGFYEEGDFFMPLINDPNAFSNKTDSKTNTKNGLWAKIWTDSLTIIP